MCRAYSLIGWKRVVWVYGLVVFATGALVADVGLAQVLLAQQQKTNAIFSWRAEVNAVKAVWGRKDGNVPPIKDMLNISEKLMKRYGALLNAGYLGNQAIYSDDEQLNRAFRNDLTKYYLFAQALTDFSGYMKKLCKSLDKKGSMADIDFRWKKLYLELRSAVANNKIPEKYTMDSVTLTSGEQGCVLAAAEAYYLEHKTSKQPHKLFNRDIRSIAQWLYPANKDLDGLVAKISSSVNNWRDKTLSKRFPGAEIADPFDYWSYETSVWQSAAFDAKISV